MAEPITVKPETQNPGGGAGDAAAEVVPKAQFDSVVQELKTLRATKSQDGAPTADIDKKIADALRSREKEEALKNKDKAMDSFVARHKEFHPDNDPGGIKKAALDRELKLLNQDGAVSVEEIAHVLEKARILAESGNNPQMVQVRIDPSIPRSNSDPKSQDGSKLTPQEARVLDQLNKLGLSEWTEERFLKLKAKDPSFVERALKGPSSS